MRRCASLLALLTACGGDVVNDAYVRRNETRVERIVRPRSVEDVRKAIRAAHADGLAVSIAGRRHATGGQQFGEGTLHLDMTSMNRVLDVDAARGQIEAEAGIQWPALMARIPEGWCLNQKQTGGDGFTLGGALSANIHGRGIGLKPVIADVEAFTLVDAQARVLRCSRDENEELFRAAIGGYGLFGVITSARLRLVPFGKLVRRVRTLDVEGLAAAIEPDARYGDFQFAIDPASDGFLRRGILTTYVPADAATPLSPEGGDLSERQFLELVALAHTEPSRAFDEYARFFASTDGRVFTVDSHQRSLFVDDYHRAIDARLGHVGTEMITELYVPPEALPEFLASVRADFRAHAVRLIYGTVRLIERDEESVFAWARKRFACVIFNLHVEHAPAALDRAAEDLRRLIDRAIERGGSYYPTYHRFATRAQVEACHPALLELLRLKRRYDPEERFQSEWYRHYRAMFAGD